jgi:uncharacterized membrane-anchored protein YitT (DUF2179 family)
MKKRVRRPWASSVAWNIFLLAVGPVIFGIGVKAIAVPHNLITGGISGSGLLLYYATGWVNPLSSGISLQELFLDPIRAV